ncbi:Enoyl-CoA hydratase/carnithine racemase [Hahella chejuensis KCTC 2396]|uniref:Enoyl-CoA hydratase/carnithine racemase n=1 Tax=Hahella chejuensis (strain KCTC 2396) TaxID=349521 RepID=Q2SAC2_HAHCH|nr:enoyl-CoA hydratase-related protein [Hahella chejuensis]ABC32402.1 Enoyl-CoA hydratase/carnithine racemase [Hahella chejuensis KCTC 2396]
MSLPVTETLLAEQRDHALHITLNRPQVRNAMSLQMVREIMALFDYADTDDSIRAMVLRGADSHFCAGGDIADMAAARAEAGSGNSDPFQALNREFGRMITRVNQASQTVVALLEGSVLGGGFGLACVSDVAITLSSARFGLPETGLGIPPAQIAPFVARRIGLTQARRLALLGVRCDGEEATRLGIAHECVANADDLAEKLATILAQIRRCAPQASAVTKKLLLDVESTELETLLDRAAADFSRAIQGPEGREGAQAFMQKRNPEWAQ